ncbi:hypothetical protein CSUB01_01929 [Colletotrichum sublineola]|uniref:Uncharacterized protein n=1 Tax=Colletotrichum sublineola TaxID=1173701 RepID=A0A066XFF3_COLSU|nr:hypothetical protein CSUB01_01929 [Colletotrichum sublineola]
MNVLPKYTERRFVWDFAQATPRDYYPSQNTQASADGTSSTYHIDSRRALETPRAGMNAGHRRAQTIWIRCWLALSQRLGQYFNPFLLLAQTDMQILSATKATEIGRLLSLFAPHRTAPHRLPPTPDEPLPRFARNSILNS